MTLPSAREIARAFGQVQKAYRKWYLLKTAREAQSVRKNELMVKMQARAAIVRRREVLAKVDRIRFRANTQAPTVKIRIPGVSD